jgi:hypothetical protein
MKFIDKVKDLFQMMVRSYIITRQMIMDRMVSWEESQKNVSKDFKVEKFDNPYGKIGVSKKILEELE